MSQRDSYPPGVPCWVDNLVPDPGRALDFYGELLGGSLTAPVPAITTWPKCSDATLPEWGRPRLACHLDGTRTCQCQVPTTPRGPRSA